MVEELARWKSALSNKVNVIQENLRKLIEERRRIRNELLKTYTTLTSVSKSLNQTPNLEENLKSTCILELSTVNCSLSVHIAQNIVKQPTKDQISITNVDNLPRSTPAENEALQVINKS